MGDLVWLLASMSRIVDLTLTLTLECAGGDTPQIQC